ENIRRLLNFFPVIAEDNEGKMIALDVNQVLTIPKTIKAKEVVHRGFMSNLLFQNISGIFASLEAKEILQQLNPVAPGKTTTHKTDKEIDTEIVDVDESGEVQIDQEIVVSQTKAHFGQKVYEDVKNQIEEVVDTDNTKLSDQLATNYKEATQTILKDLAKANGLTARTAEQVTKQNANAIALEVEVVKKQSDIKQIEAKTELKRVIERANNDPEKIAEAKANYKDLQEQIDKDFKKEITERIPEKTEELNKKATETFIKKAENKKKMTVEDDVRARLRGFTRTIPSFLMAYGNTSTTLANFDTTISDAVFKEVTGITLDQFRALRDDYQFFDGVVFDESCQEFMNKRTQLADYFDENQEEDIFDYIPMPEDTSKKFTPKNIVIKMIDAIEKENPRIFEDPNKTFIDLHVKSGMFIAELVKRLYVGLKGKFPDNEVRIKYIFENQVYACVPTELLYAITKNFLFEIGIAHV